MCLWQLRGSVLPSSGSFRYDIITGRGSGWCHTLRQYGGFFLIVDSYTENTKAWLEDRFSSSDEEGIYVAHQPIYGFLKGHCEPGLIDRYVPTFQMMKALSQFAFDSFLDVGGAEGYKAFAVREIFHPRVTNCDISEEACERAKEIFNVESVPADIHKLPFKDGEFDIVGCSETLEHVKEWQTAVRELLRVAKKAVVITLPHETHEAVEKNICEGIPHAHIHSFTTGSLDFLASEGYKVTCSRMISPLIVDAAGNSVRIFLKYTEDEKINKMLKNIISFFIQMDERICEISSQCSGLLFVVEKDSFNCRKKESREISPGMILNLSAPYYYMKPEQLPFVSGLAKGITFSIDRLEQTRRKLEIDGWARIKGENSIDSEVQIVLYESDAKHFIFETAARKRPDVTAHFGGVDLDDSGFSAVINLGSIPEGNYRVGLHIIKGELQGLFLTHRTIVI